MRKDKIIVASILSLTLLAGCSVGGADPAVAAEQAAQAEEQRRLAEVNQNDYRGALTRVDSIRTNLLGIIDDFNQRNVEIEKENPSDFWNSESYQYLSANLLDDGMWEYTKYFNELETNWDEQAQATFAQFEVPDTDPLQYSVGNLTTSHPENNSYVLSFSKETSMPFYDKFYNFENYYRCKYDAGHDWARCDRWINGNNLSINYGLLEYARISDTEFVVQTATERLYVRYKDGLYGDKVQNVETLAGQEAASENSGEVEEAAPEEPVLTDPLGTKPIAEFYYTKLNGNPRYCYAQAHIPEDVSVEKPFWEWTTEPNFSGYSNITSDQEYVCVYNYNHDSIFNDMSILGRDWVFSDNGRFKQSISYYDGQLTVKTENQLVDMLECSIFKADGTTETFTEDIYTPEIHLAKQDEEIIDGFNKSAEEEMKNMFMLSTDGFVFGERTSFENIIENRNMRMLDLNGVKYDIMAERDYEMDAYYRVLQENFETYDTGTMPNEYAIPAGKYYYISTISTNSAGEPISDNENFYSILTECTVQDEYLIRYTTYSLKDKINDCRVTLQNIKPRMSTRAQVENMLGKARSLNRIDILDEEGFTQYTVSYPDDIAAYRCENGIIYVHYDKDDIVDIVCMYAFNEPQPLDNVYGYVLSEEKEEEEK